MKKTVLLFLLISSVGFSQTKKIAFKSHSGNSANYSFALRNNLFDMNCSNFGQAPDRFIKTAKLDSVIFISDTAAILVTSSTCRETADNRITVWKEGREQANNHPLFSKQHSLDSIKKVIKQYYYFKNPIDSVKFIGYDNLKTSSSGSSSSENYKKENAFPVAGSNDQEPPRSNYPLILISLLALLSLTVGLFSWKIHQLRSKGQL